MSEDKSSRAKPRLTLITIPVALLFVLVIPLSVYFVGKWIDMFLSFPVFPPFPLNWILGPVIIVLGFGLAFGSIYQLYNAGLGLPWGPVKREVESTQLITTGLYAYTRNPMVLGFIILLSGIGWLTQSITAIIIIPFLVFIALYFWLAFKEEHQMEQKFGSEYQTYKSRTPRIFPRPWRRRIKKSNEKLVTEEEK
jgi:protein-S-isoprenylcysteine O-methyltransferase Ste14